MTNIELIARLEALTGPDREVDAEICIALNYVGPHMAGEPKNVHLDDDGRDDDGMPEWLDYEIDGEECTDLVPRMTKSIDAAVALCERVLPGWRWGVSQGTDADDEVQGNVWPGTAPFAACLDTYGYHAIPAIALLIATLKALDAKEQSDD